MARTIVRRQAPAGDPFAWQTDFAQMVRRAFGDAEASLAGAFSPALDVEEDADQFTVHVELPGVASDAVEVSIEDSVLTVSGERSFYADKEADGFRRIERSFGRFHRALRLPDRVNADQVKAAFKDGLLTVTVPKAEEAKPRRIQVDAD